MGEAGVVILADDLIWSDRLVSAVRSAGYGALPVRSAAGLAAALAREAAGVIVDLTARAYDGVEAVALATAAGVPVLAVGPHDDRDRLRHARAAGASRALAYRKLADDGPATIRAWLAAGDRSAGDGSAAPQPIATPQAALAALNGSGPDGGP